ncbi:MAG: SPOR domain-containing protein [Burkholderiaceae bacterium]|nr:SPOR domain-containing protein [Burkholderiaceae bacterium]
MLRLFVLLLILANGAYFAWSHDLLSSWGLGVVPQSEPQRLTQQIEPERIRIIKNNNVPIPVGIAVTTPATPATPAPPSASSAAAAPAMCLQAGMFNDKQAALLRQALAASLPAGTWRLDAVALPARWIVYMGKYPDNNARDLKKSQLIKINVPFEVLTEATLEPGLSLGSHDSQEAASQALNRLLKQGVRTARVLQEQPGQTGFQLVLPAMDGSAGTKLTALRSQLAGKPLQPCKNQHAG